VKRTPHLVPAVVALPVPEPWLAEDRATLVGQRFGVRRSFLRGGVYVLELGHPEGEAAEVVALRGVR
jgi:hypothetical protein